MSDLLIPLRNSNLRRLSDSVRLPSARYTVSYINIYSSHVLLISGDVSSHFIQMWQYIRIIIICAPLHHVEFHHGINGDGAYYSGILLCSSMWRARMKSISGGGSERMHAIPNRSRLILHATTLS